MTLTQTQNYMLNSQNYMKHSKNLARILFEKTKDVDFTTRLMKTYTNICYEMIEGCLQVSMPKEGSHGIENIVDKMTPEWFIEKCKKASQQKN